MGNWRTVKLEGSCDPSEVDELRTACTMDNSASGGWHCLSMSNGLCGLGHWVGCHIDALGNLCERDYEVEDVAAQLEALAKVAPSLRLTVHCGGDRESKTVVASLVLEEGVVETCAPMIATLGDISDAQMNSHFFAQLAQQSLFR